ncbi:MAG: orotidine-5'-phosphate decarboxylase [Hyphomonadaceae bacterium]|nr:orotidine-5'-phosphate decarboxylase [Hyphomonadaceae bacterium]
MTAFADRLIDAVRRNGAPLCAGLDPFPDKIPALFARKGDALAAVADFCAAYMEIAAGRAACLKPQLGLFERFGPDGYALARDVTRSARARGMIVLLDAKRGDIGTTADGYAAAAFDPHPAFDADALTVNPYLGWDSLEPFVAAAEARDRGVIVLARTSNPGAADVQDIADARGPVWAHVAAMLAAHAPRLAGESGWSGLMIVAGATWPQDAARLRAALPTSLFLVPGYGAQGAGAADAVAGFAQSPEGRVGGVVSASRALLYPDAAQRAGNLQSWREAVAAAFDRANAELRAACRA